MQLTEDEILGLKTTYECEVFQVTEAGVTYLYVPRFLPLAPDGSVDILLCPSPRDGYPSRLFFSKQIPTAAGRNWNAQGVRIADKNWFGFSWKVETPGLSIAQMLGAHLQGVR